MAKQYAKGFYESKAWKETRAAFIAARIAKDGGMCEECHSRLGYIVHHKEQISPDNINDMDITLSFNNLEYVCKECHDKIHGVFQQSDTRCMFDASGQPIPRDAVPPVIV